jgi:hypothetical protein
MEPTLKAMSLSVQPIQNLHVLYNNSEHCTEQPMLAVKCKLKRGTVLGNFR